MFSLILQAGMSRLKYYTPWHSLFATLLKRKYRSSLTVISEYALSEGPVRGDVLLIRKEAPVPLAELPVIGARLGQRTLLEFKGPTDRLELLDLPTLVGYGCFLEAQGDVKDPRDLHLMIVASGLPEPFRQRVREAGGHLISEGRGVYLIDGLMYTTYLIEAGAASETPGNGPLYLSVRACCRRRTFCKHASGRGKLTSCRCCVSISRSEGEVRR